MDILERIDLFLREVEATKDLKFIKKENALAIIEHIIASVPDDKILLEAFKQYITSEWRFGNNEILEKFYKVLGYYGIIEDESKERKTVLETKGKTIVRKFIKIQNLKQINSLLK